MFLVSMASPFQVSMAGAVSMCCARFYGLRPFLKKRNVMLNLFQHLIPFFCFTFNFVEGFAVQVSSFLLSRGAPRLNKVQYSMIVAALRATSDIFKWHCRFKKGMSS